ncbi:MAG: hypothetical protein KDD62_16125, partial [Bdellovibrionales bacterium]|nr:hypothetical protein [Bdellovibrionales bacterium]
MDPRKKRIQFVLKLAAIFFLVAGNAWAQSPQCNDGQDNDGDGTRDYLVENTNTSGGASQVFGLSGGTPDPFYLTQQVRTAIINNGIQLSPPN